MSINNSSNTDEICSFLKSLKIKDNAISKFKEEKIKGTELFYFKDEDFDNLGLKSRKTGLKKKLEEIKASKPNILNYYINIDIDSKEEEVLNFLKKEIHLDEDILEKFKNINGQTLKSLKEEDLINIGLKLGERRKLLNYMLSMKSKDINDITISSTVEEVSIFLKSKFNLPEEIINTFKMDDIDGSGFFQLTLEQLSEYELSEENQTEILNYIKDKKIEFDSKESDDKEEKKVNEIIIDKKENKESKNEIIIDKKEKKENKNEIMVDIKEEKKENKNEIIVDKKEEKKENKNEIIVDKKEEEKEEKNEIIVDKKEEEKEGKNEIIVDKKEEEKEGKNEIIVDKKEEKKENKNEIIVDKKEEEKEGKNEIIMDKNEEEKEGKKEKTEKEKKEDKGYEGEEEEVEEEIIMEEKFRHFELIDIKEYKTSENEYNKCPFNKTEGFIELCNFMGIENKENCKIIDFDQANKMNLKVSTLWGSIDALFDFFKNKKMLNSIEYFNNLKDKSGGIYLLIKEDKSFGYILIWPGKMHYLYRKLEEPQKDLLLSLVRIGFSLSDYNIICLTEKQKNEFDFQAIKIFDSEDIPEATEGKINYLEEESYFKLGEDLEIKYELDTKEKITDFKLNNSSVFFNISMEESITSQSYDKIPKEQLNFNVQNVIFSQNFELNDYDFYNFAKQFYCLKDLILENEYQEIEKIVKEQLKKIKSFYLDSLSLLINNFKNNNFICEICKKRDNKELYSFTNDNYSIYVAHLNCFNKGVGINQTSSIFITKNKKCDICFELFSLFYQNCVTKYSKFSKLNENVAESLIKLGKIKGLFKEKSYLNNLNNLYNEITNIINTEFRRMLSETDKDIELRYLNWKNGVIKKIKEFHESKYKELYSWHEYTNATYDNKTKKFYFSYKTHKKNKSKDIIKLFTFFKNSKNNYHELKSNEEKKWNKNEYDYKFDNYYDRGKNGILVRKLKDSYEIKLKEKTILFNNCYDYYKDILIISRKDEASSSSVFGGFIGTISFGYLNSKNEKSATYIQVIYLDEENKIKLYKDYVLKDIENLSRIKLVPNYGSSPKYALLFSDNLISLINIGDFQNLDNLKISDIYKGINININLLQFLVYEKFLLIFFYDEKKWSWDFDVFEIKSDKIIRKEKSEYNLNYSSKKGKFSIFSIKNEEPVLYFCYLENKKFHIKLKRILTSLSNLIIETNTNDEPELNLTEGNCVLNYFYYAFIKYPSLSALQYNYQGNAKLKNIYIYSKGLKQTQKFKNYIKELKQLFINERQLISEDIKYEFKGIFKKDKIVTSMNLEDLIIKFIQVIPLQIAKIKNYYFKAMSDGKDIKKEELYEKYLKDINDENVQISVEDYANYIGFGMKNSIFNFYDLPVVVLAFMGAQSIGKSTLSNELVESFFNVSGMRCTEGIWMAVSLLKGNKSLIKCEGKCQCCNDENCKLFIHSVEIQCICDNCCCNEICCLYKGELEEKKDKDKLNQNFCEKRCSLPLGHINMCNIHNNKKCEKHRNKCKCGKINKKLDKHICEISPYNHGFICVSLDFEGLGTFERSLEQDLDLAMVGAALANSLILRADKTFDTFMQKRMMDWSEGSKKIKNFKNTHYFGGNIIFCQKDIPKNNEEEVKEEYETKMRESIKNWIEYINNKENDYNNKNQFINKKQVFGIFSKYINSPTRIFNRKEFYISLRKGLIHTIIKNILMNKSFPNYRTGQEFMLYLQGILATVDIHDYNILENLAIDNLKRYLSENRIKAMEIFGIYPNKLEKNEFNDIEELEDYLNLNLEKLKTSYISNSKLIVDETLNINVISENIKTEKLENIKYKNFIININILENKDKEKSYKLIIDGIRESGLLLLIPLEYKDKFGIDSIRKNLFSLWKTICYNLNFSNFEIITNFKEFISEIIKRRNDNIDKWLDNLTSSFVEIDTKSIKKYNFSLKEIWKICGEKCHQCFYSCTKIIGHEKEHDCEFDHKCHEKCQICENIIKCNQEDCDLVCKHKIAGHGEDNDMPENIKHVCSHFHKCQKQKDCYLNYLTECTKICQLEFNHKGECFCNSKHLCDKDCCYKDYSRGCQIKCNEEINHKGEHKCGSKVHFCTRDCSLKNVSKNCKGTCSLTLPHIEGGCNCKGNHYCIKDCSLKDKSRDCGGKCILPYGHFVECKCDKRHKCKEECHCKYKARECKEICDLDYGHDENMLHDCGEKHYCDSECSYKSKARNCIDKKCIKEFNHEGVCTCGAEHLCSKTCSINNCGKLCNLLYDHKEKECNCKGPHKCQKECYLFSFSKINTCKGKCHLEYGHKGICQCNIPPEEHKCNKKCSGCKRPCVLNANHKEKYCLCGECKCNIEDCQYKNISRNCQKKCGKNLGHDGPHQCEEKNHLCIKYCNYREKTKKENGGCLEYCKLPAGHEGENHFCENPKEKHKCPGICSLKNESSVESCNKFCDKSIDHEPPCICNIEIENHICNKICSLFEKSKKGCNKFCKLKTNHEGPCFCSAKKEEHKCKGICSLKKESKAGCLNDCKFSPNHLGDCLCQNSEKDHICNGVCSLKANSREETCYDHCSLHIRHKGQCICYSKKHICAKDCVYKSESRSGCYGRCFKETGHKGEHICDNELKNHKCNKKCHLAEKSRLGCSQFCDNIPGHNGECLCDSKLVHLCNGTCYLSNICHKGQLYFCGKNASHTDKDKNDKHDCLKEKEHLCNKHCKLENKSRECKIECCLPYNHEKLYNTECMCENPLNKHLCIQKCELCKVERPCEFKYGHEGHHLCDNEHNCVAKCEHEGICEIITRKDLSKKKTHVFSKNNEILEFEEKTEQISRRLLCNISISPKKADHKHKGKHICEILVHKCGYRCKQCDRMCNLEYGHEKFHDCEHGHIVNATVFTEGNDAKLNYLNRQLEFQRGESPNMFTCYMYCKEQGRGHVHIIDNSNLENLNEEIERESINIINNILYCKCEYFWKNILNFKFDDKFEKEQKISFNKCSAECLLCKQANKKTYCELDLWHEPFNRAEEINGENFWISKDGHKFTCEHPIPCHTIFIVDKSGSMKYNDITPSIPSISQNQNFNNRFGKLIENMDNYIKKRKSISPEDVFSLVAFSDKAEIIFSNHNCDLNDNNFNFIQECMQKINECKGETEFYLGFTEGEKILNSIDRKKYKPVIILFSDGADQKPEQTIEIIERIMKTNEKSENNLIIFAILLNIYDKFFTSWFGINREQGIKHMTKIARLGGSNNLYLLITPDSMHQTFIKIADSITQRYGLKINEY